MMKILRRAEYHHKTVADQWYVKMSYYTPDSVPLPMLGEVIIPANDMAHAIAIRDAINGQQSNQTEIEIP